LNRGRGNEVESLSGWGWPACPSIFASLQKGYTDEGAEKISKLENEVELKLNDQDRRQSTVGAPSVKIIFTSSGLRKL